jgi:cation transport ATPase
MIGCGIVHASGSIAKSLRQHKPIVEGGRALELAREIDAALLDQAGTLTHEHPARLTGVAQRLFFA